MLVDSHCHLDFPDFASDRADVLARARNAGVGVMVTIGTRLTKFPEVLAIAESAPQIYCTVGVHPHEAEKEGVGDPAPLLDAATHPKVVGIGETGLDYYYKHSAPDAQERSFRAHIAAARETGLPLVVHARDADTDTGVAERTVGLNLNRTRLVDDVLKRCIPRQQRIFSQFLERRQRADHDAPLERLNAAHQAGIADVIGGAADA